MLYCCHTHGGKKKEDYAIYDLCDSGVYSREITDMFFIGQVSGLVRNFNIGIYSHTIDMIQVKLYMLVLLIKVSPFIPLSLTLTTFQGHSNVEQFQLKILCSYSFR